MKIKTLIPNVGLFDRKAGEIVEVSKEDGERWIKEGYAEEVKEAEKKPAPKKK